MGADAKRKTRRGRRGGEGKRQKDAGAEVAAGEQHAANGRGEPAPAAADGYVAPPMETADSVFYFDTTGQGSTSASEAAEKVSPASYGLVNPDLQKYLKSCEGMLDQPDFETAEDRDIFVRNVYGEMKNHELQLTTDHECSRILEKLFRISSEYQIQRFFSITREDTLRLAIHRFSSHTIQTLLLLSAVALEREARGETSSFSADAEDDGGDGAASVRTELPSFEQLVLGVVEALTPHWPFLMSNEYASHILRVLLLVLSGRPIEDQANPKSSIKSKRSTKYMEDRNGAPASHRSLAAQRTVPESFAAALDQLLSKASGAMSDVVARGFTNSPVGCPVLQLMLEFDAGRGRLEEPGSLLDKCLMGLISDGGKGENPRRDAVVKMALEDVVGSHFLQKVAEVASEALFQTLYDRYFSRNLRQLAQHPIANFVVQSMFEHAKNADQLKAMIAQTAPLVRNLLFGRRAGVVRALLVACSRLGACYGEIMDALYCGLGISAAEERKELINLLAFLMSYPEFAKADYYQLPFNIQGALIIQAIVQLPGSGHEPLLDSYFGQDAERLLSWCKDASGSRIIEAIISSPHVPKRTKNRVLQGYVGRFVDLAVDKYGSHVVDSCWAAAGIEFKEKIVGELVRGEARLQDSPFGRTVLRNCGAEQYKRRADEWRQRERNIEKRKRVFKDIVGSDAPAASRRPAKDAAKVCTCTSVAGVSMRLCGRLHH
ncbi:Nucleolar protein 9 [Coemansia helicoidea]|uniref:Nucleolar protein 9 n=1 Tax=Coemansia helicoidea TaxID=1286919 RepID=A0ACC1KZM1_9FUNG|nr:Nucleolar protein 9 [Coemansia helicoidea]